MIKQEVKGAVKSEIKSEQAAASTVNLEIDSSEYEEQFEVMAMGVVTDELP